MGAIVAADQKRTPEPVAYIEGVLKKGGGQKEEDVDYAGCISIRDI